MGYRTSCRLASSMAAFALLGSIAVMSTPARGAGPKTADQETAEVLFKRGRELLDAGKHAEACAAFADSMRLEPAGGTLLNLALCHELEGKLATAAEEYRRALQRAVEDAREDRAQFARERLAVVGPRVATVTIELNGVAGATATLDGNPIPDDALTRPIPVDPGERFFVVSRPGAEPYERRLMVPEDPGWRGRLTVPVTVAPLPPPTAAPSVPVASCPPSTRLVEGECRPWPAPIDRGPTTEERRPTTWHWVGLGVGVAGLATSAFTGVQALRANGDAKDGCVEEREFCTSEGQDAANRANDMAWVSTAALGVGVTGLALWMWLPREESTEGTSVGVAPAPTGGVMLRGRTTF